MEDITVIQAKRFGIYSCPTDTTLLQAAQTMVDEDISGLVVVNQNGHLEGIITRTDLLHACHRYPHWSDQLVAQFMNMDVVTVSPQDHLDFVASLMIEQHIHRVVVVENDKGSKRPVGVISDGDILFHLVRKN